MMTRFMQILRLLLDALSDKPESPEELETVSSIYPSQNDSEVRRRALK